jgi:hypothetical protein
MASLFGHEKTAVLPSEKQGRAWNAASREELILHLHEAYPPGAGYDLIARDDYRFYAALRKHGITRGSRR